MNRRKRSALGVVLVWQCLVGAARAEAEASPPAPPPEPETPAPSPVEPEAPPVAPGPQEAPAPPVTPPAAPPVTPPPAPPPSGPAKAPSAPPKAKVPARALAPGEAEPRRQAFTVELGVGAAAGARFPEAAGRRVEEAVDSVVSLGVGFGLGSLSLGLVAERLGLGKDHYGATASGSSVAASRAVDSLWLSGRLYLAPGRPSAYLGAAIGPGLPRLSASGTRDGDDAFSAAARPFQCTDVGPVGLGLGLSAGLEADIAAAWSLLGEARATGHLLSDAADAHGSCGPGPGPAVGGALRVSVAYRFGSSAGRAEVRPGSSAPPR